jgi:hypothetical protein
MMPSVLALVLASSLPPERPAWRDAEVRVLPDAAATLALEDGWADLPGGGFCQLAAPPRYADLTDATYGEEAVLHLACAASGAARFDLVSVQGRTTRGWRPLGAHHAPVAAATAAAPVPRHPTDRRLGGFVVMLEPSAHAAWVWTELRLDPEAKQLVPTERARLSAERLRARIFEQPRRASDPGDRWAAARRESLAELVRSPAPSR